MKILHVCANYYPAFGGPQYTMKHLSEKLVEYYGDQVEVATSNSLYGPELSLFEEINPLEQIINGVEINRFPFRRWHYYSIEQAGRLYKKIVKKPLPHSIRKYRWEMDCKGIEQKMALTHSDVIMATTINYMFCDYPLWRFKTKNPKPFILYGALHLHIDWPINSPVIKRSRICDCYIANTEYERQKLIGYGVKEKKIVTIGTGINVNDMVCDKESVQAFRNKYHIENDDVLIGHIGRLSSGKGAGLLLEAFIQLYQKNKKCKLLLAGTVTDFVENLKYKARQYNVPVIILENFENNLKPLLFNAIDIFVLASRGESFGVVFLEAWACKKPVIGCNEGAISSLLSENIDSLLFYTANAEDLSNKLELLIRDKQKTILLGINGYKKVLQHFTWPQIVSKYREAYYLGIENFRKQYFEFKKMA